MGNLQEHFREDLKIRFHEHVERVTNDSLGGVLDWDYAIIGAALVDVIEHLGYGTGREIACGTPELLESGQMSECRKRAEVTDHQRFLEASAR
jgi:hypothetical protein